LDAGDFATDSGDLRPRETSLRFGGSQKTVNIDENRGFRLTSIGLFFVSSSVD
jgi:hypothetical protein